MRGNGDETFERSSLKLLRRAMAHGDPEAWAGFQQCLEETILTWLHEHPGGEAARRGLCEKDVVAQAFERFRQGAVGGQTACETLTEVLVALHVHLHGVILERLRLLSRPQAVSRLVSALTAEPCVEDQLDGHEIWELLQTLLPSARERRLAYLLYHCGLGPQEIVQCCSQEWTDVQEISRLRRDIVERLLHHADIQESRWSLLIRQDMSRSDAENQC